MAIIQCPKCKKEISDKSEKCVHCGYVLITKKKFCSECGNELEEETEICPKCGCPVVKSDKSEPQQVEVTKVKLGEGIPKKAIMIGLVSILVVIGIIYGITAINKQNAEKEAKQLTEQYKSNLETITYKMLSGAAQAEDCGNKIKKVWSNTIWEDDDPETDKYTKKNGVFNDDFNDSLSALFADPDFIEITDGVEQNQTEVNKLMKDMKNPPKEWEEAYSDLKDYYDDYLTLTNLCTNPSGSLTTYSSNFSTADSDALNGYNKMKTYLDY